MLAMSNQQQLQQQQKEEKQQNRIFSFNKADTGFNMNKSGQNHNNKQEWYPLYTIFALRQLFIEAYF